MYKRIQIIIKLVTAKSRNMYLKAKKAFYKFLIWKQTLQILSEKKIFTNFKIIGNI